MARVPTGSGVWGLRGSVTSQRRDQARGTERERDRRVSIFSEATRTLPVAGGALVLGVAAEGDLYRNTDVAGFDDDQWTLGAFGQFDWDPTERVGVTLTARVDHHNEAGTFVSPRVAARWRLDDSWTLRISGGSGFVAPTPFIEETEAIGLARLEPLRGLESERLVGGSLDLGGTLAGVEPGGWRSSRSSASLAAPWPRTLAGASPPGAGRITGACTGACPGTGRTPGTGWTGCTGCTG